MTSQKVAVSLALCEPVRFAQTSFGWVKAMEGTPPTPPTPPEVTRMFQKMAGKISTSSSGSSSDSSSSSSSAGADQRTNTEGVAKETTPTADGEPGKAGQYQQQESDDEGKVAQLMKEQAKLGCNELEPWQNLRNASFAAREASKSKWPDGPRSYKELFGWADYNSQVLLSDLPDKQAHKSNLVALMSRGIQHHDAFSGLGTASIACKSQLQSMSRLLKQSAGLPPPTTPFWRKNENHKWKRFYMWKAFFRVLRRTRFSRCCARC